MNNLGSFPRGTPGGTPPCVSVSEGTFAEYSASGWTSSMRPAYVEYTGFDNLYNDTGFQLSDPCIPAQGGENNNASYIRRLQVHLPSGESHELRMDDTIMVYDRTGCTGCPQTAPSYDHNWNGWYYAVDGSNLKYFEDRTNNVYMLYMPDGSRYNFANAKTGDENYKTIRKAEYFADVNGNRITYHAPTSGFLNGYWTDTLGRTLGVPMPSNEPSSPVVEEYKMPGLTGPAERTYKFHWKKLKDASESMSALTNFYQDLKYTADFNTPPMFPGIQAQRSASTTLFHSALTSAWVVDTYSVSGVPAIFNPVLLTAIELPNGQMYEFSYNIYGEIDNVVYPTGGSETFLHQSVPTLTKYTQPGQPTTEANRGVQTRNVLEYVGDPTPYTWTYEGIQNAQTSYQVNITNPDGTRSERLLYQGKLVSSGATNGDWGYDRSLAGMAFDERSYSSTSQLLSKTVRDWTKTSFGLYFGQVQAEWHPRVAQEENIIYDPATSGALSTTTTMDYGDMSATITALNTKVLKKYAFTTTLGSLGTLEKTTETDYLSDSNYIAKNLRSLPSEVRVKDASGNVKAKSQITYDGVSLLSESTSSRWVNPNTNYRGLVTKTRSWYDIANNLYIDTQAQYDLMGNLRYATDGRGNVSQTLYSPTYDYAYPTSVITPIPDSSGVNGSATAFTSSTAYDYNTGLPTSSTDINGQTSYMEYNDALLRPTKATAPNGQQTITEYGAGTSASTRWVKSRSQIDASAWKEGYSYFDGLGRAVRSQSIDDDGDVFSLTCYDTMGRVSKATNPFRGYTNQDCSTTTGLDWTTNTFDTAGRPWKVTTPDGAVVETIYGLATSGGQIGSSVTVKDQALKERRSVTNALGQLIRVDEPTTAGLGAIETPNQPTYYVYDTLNNLATVKQGGTFASPVQTRSFVYDSLARLKSAINPESGQIQYTYDNNGNLATKTDARSISTTYTYDNLNRVTFRNYSETTPDVSYFYDNLTNAKGKLKKVSSSVSTTEYTAFDILGRVTAHKQTTDGIDYTTGYTYNLGGALVEETYPSGRVAKNVLDNSGDLSAVQSKKNANSGYWNYADSLSYNAAGAVTSIQLGNGRWESTVFSKRFQPERIALGTTPGATDKLKLDYTYGTTNNNGNVLTQTITVPGMTYPLVQNYTYDALNRLDDANETSNGTQTWRQDFDYDRYGNRNFVQANTTMPSSFANPAVSNPAISTTNNRITSTGFLYDTAGNTTRDAAYQTFTYDAENKQSEVKNASSVTLGQYYYDGDGKRVKKYVPSSGETTVFVYDLGGKSIAEYSTVVEPSSTANVAYLTSDHLGSPRITTDQNGAISSRHDYHPFGEEIGSGGRTTGVGYGDDSVRKQFTGYERDDESGLDFAQARYYMNLLGRFSTPDDLMNDSSTNDPQSWNKYVFVRNTPLNLIDPTGEKATIYITTDKKNKTGTIMISASFGVYGQIGEYSQAELEQQAAQLRTQIEETYRGGFVLDGVTYSVSASVSTQVFGSESDAAAAGQRGEIDNIVGLRATSDFSISQNGGKAKSGNVGAGYNIANEDFDRMVVSTGNSLISKRNTFAHEFGHLMGGQHHKPGLTEGLMRDGQEVDSRGRYLTHNDFDMVLAQPARKHVAGTGGPFSGGRSSNSVFVTGAYRATTDQLGACKDL